MRIVEWEVLNSSGLGDEYFGRKIFEVRGSVLVRNR